VLESIKVTMFPLRIALAVASRQKLLRTRFAIGAAVSLAVYAEYNRRNALDEEEPKTDRNELFRRSDPEISIHSLLAPNMTQCSFLSSRFPSLTRSSTLRRMEDTSTKDTLKSKYDVQWRTPLGEGGFGAVYIATDRKTKEKVAVKKIAKKFTDNRSFQQEMNAFLHIRQRGGHPNICGLRENFDEGEYFYLVLDLVSGGEMFDHLCSHGAYSEADAARLVREVASALAFLHGTGCVHGDLKPENLMLSSEHQSDAVIKLVDFGCAQIVDQDSPLYDRSGSFVAANTPGYSPPEMVRKEQKLKELHQSVDMWSLGVIIYIMLTGIHPFDLAGNSTDIQINEAVMSKKGPPIRKSPITAHLSSSAIELIETLIQANPNKRLTALQMLEHPWVRGETARKGKMADSDKRLSAYRAFKSRLEAKVFASMVEWSGDSAENDVAKRTSLIERSFHMLDPEHLGYITTKSLQKLNPENKTDVADEESQLSLSGFSDLLAENMQNRYFPAGHIIYHEGEKGHKMYFINSGRVEVSTKDGFKATTEQGDCFGEGALLHSDAIRSATIRTITPVHAIEISREYFEKFLAGGTDVKLSLREKDKMRKRQRAKSILNMQQNMVTNVTKKGGHIYRHGDKGNDLYILEEGVVDVRINKHTVFSVQPGELFGEHSLMFGMPRNNSATCATKECKYHVMLAKDLFKLLESHPSVKDSLRDICLRREFMKALVFATKKAFPTRDQDLWAAFDAADFNRSGRLDLSDIAQMVKQMDGTYTDENVKEILDSLDLDQTGAVSFAEFKKMFGMSLNETQTKR
jgi:serine/threonine protein kinase